MFREEKRERFLSPADLSTTLKIYTQVASPEMKAAMDKVQQVFRADNL